MTEFFVPDTSSSEEAEQIWTATRKFALETMGKEIGTRRIFRLRYVHNGRRLAAEVGKLEPLTREPVFVILDSDPYLICTPNRGVLRGMPVLVGRKAVLGRVDFDDQEEGK